MEGKIHFRPEDDDKHGEHRLLAPRWPKLCRHSLSENLLPWCGSALTQGIRYIKYREEEG